MTAPTNISGKDGKLKVGSATIASCRKIATNFKSNNPKFATEATGGFKTGVAGVKSGSVTFDLVLDVDGPQYGIYDVGAAVTLLVYENATRFWTIPIRIDEIDENIDIDNGGEVTLGFKASTEGAWTQPT